MTAPLNHDEAVRAEALVAAVAYTEATRQSLTDTTVTQVAEVFRKYIQDGNFNQ